MEKLHSDYISDLIKILLLKLDELKIEAKKDDYIKGQIFAYYDTLDTIKCQAQLFNLSIPELDNIILEDYLQ